MKPSVSMSLNGVRAALSPTEYRTARDVMSITGYCYATIYNAFTMLEYRGQIEVQRFSEGNRTNLKKVRRII